MLDNSLTQNLTEEQKKIAEEFLDLIMEKTLKHYYLGLNDSGKKDMANTFTLADDKAKEMFISENFSELEKIFISETEKTIEEIKRKGISIK